MVDILRKERILVSESEPVYIKDMSQIEKLLEKLKKSPKNISFTETVRIFENYGYIMTTGGKTSGATVTFKNVGGDTFSMHKPHPSGKLKLYAVRNIRLFLEERKLI